MARTRWRLDARELGGFTLDGESGDVGDVERGRQPRMRTRVVEDARDGAEGVVGAVLDEDAKGGRRTRARGRVVERRWGRSRWPRTVECCRGGGVVGTLTNVQRRSNGGARSEKAEVVDGVGREGGSRRRWVGEEGGENKSSRWEEKTRVVGDKEI